jgi:predicted nucleic acid-binding protein
LIFIDTSAIYALADRADPNHIVAVDNLQAILDQGETLLTHNYVLLESLALVQSRLGLSAASKLARDSQHFVVDWIDEELHRQAVVSLHKIGKRHISLVDHVSFLIMKRRNLDTAFAFDPDFNSQGFICFSR